MLENLQPIAKLPSCKVRTLAESLEAKDRAILENALTDSKWNPNSLSVALKQRGIELANKLIRKHQLQRCSCAQLGK
jgi:plasmid stability protein